MSTVGWKFKKICANSCRNMGVPPFQNDEFWYKKNREEKGSKLNTCALIINTVFTEIKMCVIYQNCILSTFPSHIKI